MKLITEREWIRTVRERFHDAFGNFIVAKIQPYPIYLPYAQLVGRRWTADVILGRLELLDLEVATPDEIDLAMGRSPDQSFCRLQCGECRGFFPELVEVSSYTLIPERAYQLNLATCARLCGTCLISAFKLIESYR